VRPSPPPTTTCHVCLAFSVLLSFKQFNKTSLNELLNAPGGVCFPANSTCSCIIEPVITISEARNVYDFVVDIEFASNPSSNDIERVGDVIAELFTRIFVEYCCFVPPSFKISLKGTLKRASFIVEYSSSIDLNANGGLIPPGQSTAPPTTFSALSFAVSMMFAFMFYLL